MTKVCAILLSLAVAATVGGCVYKIDIPQGTSITQTKASRLHIGMTKEQVLYLLGSPAIIDTLNPNRWDYLYDYTAGTDGKRAGKPNVKDASQYASVYFDVNGRVTKIDGIANLPK